VRALARSGAIDKAKALLEGPDAAVFDYAAHADLAEAMFRLERYEEAVAYEKGLFERYAKPDAAYNVACSLARLGKVDEGLQWLERAIDAGFRDGKLLDEDEDIAALRTDARFAGLRGRVART
jgi:tetratricopeptide (TPR) repeat protein